MPKQKTITKQEQGKPLIDILGDTPTKKQMIATIYGTMRRLESKLDRIQNMVEELELGDKDE